MKVVMFHRLFSALLITAVFWNCSVRADLAPLAVTGNKLTANGQPIRLRGINWGWWHLSGTRYSETDMEHARAWGANVIRLAFSYGDLEDIQTGALNKSGFKSMDQVADWARKYHMYVILDMHVVPGGQSYQQYTDGGRDLVFSSPQWEQRYDDLWQAIAVRYRTRPEIAAYELMNEPNTGSAPQSRLPEVNRKAIEAIRAVDPDKVIVVTGNFGSGASSMTGSVIVPGSNILYTFHFYDGGGDQWLGNTGETNGWTGTRDWTLFQRYFTAPANATHVQIMLRSTANSGTAWFDDVRLEEEGGKVLAHASFDTGTDGYHPERGLHTLMTFDPAVGHEAAGSLSVHGTIDYNGWVSPSIVVQPGKSYVISSWIKLQDATGVTYVTGALSGHTALDKDGLRKQMAPAVQFATTNHVPVWVGEFGCPEDAPNHDQTRWVQDCISLFEEAGFDWTYWNFKETTEPTSMALQAEHKDGSDYPVNNDLLEVLRSGWSLNSSDSTASRL